MNVVHVGSVVGGTAYAPRTTGTARSLSGDVERPERTHSSSMDEGKRHSARTARSYGRTRARRAEDGVRRCCHCDHGRRAGARRPVGQQLASRAVLLDGRSRLPIKTERAATGPGSGGHLQCTRTQLPGRAAGRASAKTSVEPRPRGSRYVPFVRASRRRAGSIRPSSSRSSFYGAPWSRGRPQRARRPTTSSGAGRSTRGRPPAGMQTPATSAMLPLKAGTWWYRVRGINPYLPGNQKMSWSNRCGSRSPSRPSGSSGASDRCVGAWQPRAARSRRAVDRDDRDGRRGHGSRRRPQLRHGDAAAGS